MKTETIIEAMIRAYDRRNFGLSVRRQSRRARQYRKFRARLIEIGDQRQGYRGYIDSLMSILRGK
jgi:hypothetical protein